MKTYLTYRAQLEGLQDVLETIKTTEKIAASSIHFLRAKVATLASYTQLLQETLAKISSFHSPAAISLLKPRQGKRKLLVVLTGDGGLVGGLWHSIVSTAIAARSSYTGIVVVGKKGVRYFAEEHITPTSTFSSQENAQAAAKELSRYLFAQFQDGNAAAIDILYPQFVTLTTHIPTTVPFLPFPFLRPQIQDPHPPPVGIPIIAPSSRTILTVLVKKFINVYLYRIVLETQLSEFSARTAAMEHAGAKTEESINMLVTEFRKERRQHITQRQIESFIAHRTI
ncbi:hypothetical protein D6779_05420 [Candidatus Parcubacteria bacterium]|nr:MAG: hypothetical protein D6779_05420 [Candidatus Parcubacteria bacterium]